MNANYTYLYNIATFRDLALWQQGPSFQIVSPSASATLTFLSFPRFNGQHHEGQMDRGWCTFQFVFKRDARDAKDESAGLEFPVRVDGFEVAQNESLRSASFSKSLFVRIR